MTGRIVSRQEQDRLWRLAVAGDREAADALVRCCLPKIRRLAGKYGRHAPGGESDDLEQLGLIHVARAIPRYDPARGSFFNFGVSVASKKMVEASRRSAARSMAAAGDALPLVPDRDGGWRTEAIERVAAALAALPEMERVVVELREGYGRQRLGVADVARRLGVGVRAVHAAHDRAVNRLSDLLADLAG